jgi:DNA polymerase/3'-5' exonuclease PolX
LQGENSFRCNAYHNGARAIAQLEEDLGEVLAVAGLYNQMNKLADAYQVEPDILPEAR